MCLAYSIMRIGIDLDNGTFSPVYVKAISSMRRLQDNGENVFFITDDPRTYFEKMRQLDHLDTLFNPGNFHFTRKGESSNRADVAESLSLNHYVDSDYENVVEVSSRGIHSILFETLGKKKKIPDNVERAFSWPHIISCVYDEEKLFRFLVRHPSNNLFPFYRFKAKKRAKLCVPSVGSEKGSFDPSKVESSIIGGQAMDIMLGTLEGSAIAASIIYGSPVLEGFAEGVESFADYVFSLPGQFGSGASDWLRANMF